jgi:peptidoglycan/LPS O-acetylase OafA/YrhL
MASIGNLRQFHISPFQSDFLNLSRWLAALLVVVEHLRSLLFTDYETGGRMGVIGKVFYFVTGFGHAAVMVFFVMSGFLVGGKVLAALLEGDFAWQKYAIDRFSRLYSVYVLALLSGGALDYLGYHFFNHFGFYDQTFSGRIAVINHDFHQTLSVSIFAVNLGMCQTILAPVFGSNGPLWSLANEFWYYTAGPILLGLFFLRAGWKLFFGAVALALIFWFLPESILIYGLVWLLGAAVYVLNRRKLLPLWVSLVVFTVCFSIARMQWFKIPYLADFLIGISFALVINSTAGGAWRIPWHHFSRMAAGFSYSVYLCHFPLLVFILSVLFQKRWIGFRAPPTLSSAAIFLLILGVVYGWCFLISLITERRTSQIRAWLG